MADQKTLSIENLTEAIAQNNVKIKEWVNTQIGNVKVISILWVDELPTTDISTSAIYLVKNEENSKDTNNIYDEYVYKDGVGWEILGQVDAGSVDLSNYYTKAQVDAILKSYTKQDQVHKHDNKDILDSLSDVDGTLNYNGTPIQTEIQICKDENNALKKRQDGLYVPQSMTQETAENEIAELKRQNKLLQEEIDSIGEMLDSINKVVI